MAITGMIVSPFAWASVTVCLIIVIYASILSFKGRKIDRGMMLVNALSGLFVFIAYSLFIIDLEFIDFMSRQQSSDLCMRPAIFVACCCILANVIRLGAHNRAN